jgi:hypothetical protein
VEKRYRENLNSSITQLRLALQNTDRVGRRMRQEQKEEPEYRQQTLHRVRKSDVILEAMDYVHQTEVELRHMVSPPIIMPLSDLFLADDMPCFYPSEVFALPGSLRAVQTESIMVQTRAYSERQADEVELLRKRARQLEKLVKCRDCALMKQLVDLNL